MVLSDYTKLRILSLHWQGYKISRIADILVLEDSTTVSRQSIRLFLKRFIQRGTIARKPGSGRTLKLSPAIPQIIERAMQEDDETTATQIQANLASHDVYVSLTTILRNRRQMGWIYRGSAYCQLIRNVNKQKRLEWAQQNLRNNFDDVIWSDESSIQLDCHRRYCCRKEGQRPHPKPRPKHPTKVHVWAGISKKVYVSLRGKWMLHCSAKYYDEHSYLSLRKNFHLQVHIDLCRTTTPSTVQELLRDSMRRLASTGGVLPRSRPILIP